MKNFLNIKDLSTKELRKILTDAKKEKKKNFNTMDPDKDLPLKGKLIIQMYEKQSSRTRLSFHIAIKQLGANTINVKATELHLGKVVKAYPILLKSYQLMVTVFCLEQIVIKKF